MSDPRTDLPAPGAPNFNQRLREVIQTYLGRQGNPLDRGLTIRDLVDTGVLKLRAGFQLKPGAGSSIPLEPGDGVVDTYEPDLTPPPTPGNMTVTASISHVMIEHEAPIYRQGHGHLRTRVYGKVVNAGDPLPTFADAAEIGQFSGTIYAQPSNPATTWRLWTKWETVDGALSVDPAGGINGMEVITGQDVALLLEALNGEITESQLYQDLASRIDLIDGPDTLAGSVSAKIKSEQIERATATGALAKSITTLQASAGTGGLVYNGSFANGSAEGWAGLAGVSSTPYGGLPKAYAGIQTTRDINFPNTDASQWMACKPGDEFEVSAWVSAEHASPMYSIGVQYEKTDGRIDNWVPIASTEGPTTAKFLRGYWTAPNDVRRLRFWGQIDTPNGTTVSAWGITDVQLRRTDVRTSAIQILAEASDDKIKGLYAQYTVKLDVGGLVSGYGLASTDTASAFGIRADRFWISGPAHVSDQPPPRSSLYLGKAWYDTTYKEVYYVTAINGNQVTWMAGGTPETDAAIAALVSPFVVQATPTTINGVAVPAGVYIKDAYIQNGTITNAKIANAAIDDAKIASLSATKLTAGQLQVGSWIASSNYVAGAQGWAINSDGTAELSNAVVRGTVYATSGEFSGTVKAGTTILGGLAASYGSGAGFYGGLESGAYKWRVGSPTGARIQWTGAAIEVYDASNKLTISSSGVDWGSVTGQGRPADGATAGAPAGTYVGDKLAESLVADVLGAVSAASNASSDATAALDLISDISSDSKFTPIERLAARKEWDEIAGEWFGIYASGGNFGLTALQEAYQAATRALGSYLNGAPWISFDVIPAGISEAYLNATTEINSTEFRSKFKDYYTARQALLNAVADVAATRATWPSVTGEGRPADGATVGATFGVNISGQITPSNASTYIANAAIGTAHIADAAINSAKIGSASIMTANIGEAQVNTLQIAGNAVTVPEVATGDSTIAGNGEYQYILGTQITISEPGMVMASFAAKQDFPNGGRRWDVKLYIDGVERFYTYGGIANDSISMSGALYISTAKTVNISVYWKGADEYCYVKNRCLWAMVAKR